jgi:hypothetical protein
MGKDFNIFEVTRSVPYVFFYYCQHQLLLNKERRQNTERRYSFLNKFQEAGYRTKLCEQKIVNIQVSCFPFLSVKHFLFITASDVLLSLHIFWDQRNFPIKTGFSLIQDVIRKVQGNQKKLELNGRRQFLICADRFNLFNRMCML